MAGKKVLLNAQRILNQLEIQPRLTTAEATELLDVSEATVRRLFTKMAGEGTVIRTFGGISLPQRSPPAYSYEALQRQNTAAKAEIAQKALALCRPGEVIYLDGGTTLAALAGALAEALEEGKLENIEVYTNSLVNLTLLSPHCPVSLIGGRWRERRRDFCGYLAEEAVRKLVFGACFLGADAVEERGFTATDFETARLNELVLAASQRRYILAGAEKLGGSSFVPFAPLSAPEGFLTNSGLGGDTVRHFTALGLSFV